MKAEKLNLKLLFIKGSRVVVLLVLFIVFSLFTENFFRLNNWSNIENILLQEAPFYMMLALAMVIPMIVGGLDLSVGSNISLSSFVCAMVIQQMGNSLLAILSGLLVGCLIGMINGYIIAEIGVPPFVATYSMDWIAKGAVLVISKGGQITGFNSFRAIFNSWRGTYLLISLVFMVLAWVLYTKTVFGKRTYCVGCNTEAARISGMKSAQIKILAYLASGFVAAMTGMMYISKLGAAEPTLGGAFTMEAIAAALIGGASFIGAKSKISNALVGGLIIVVLNNGLIHIGVPGVWQDCAQGIIIIAAILLERLLEKMQMEK